MIDSKRIKTRELTLCALFTALIIVGAFIKIPFPYVPVTLQFLFVNLAALILGKNLGALSVLVYIVLGLIGIPVFTQGGGISYIFQPTFGYLIGFLIGTFAAGKIVDRMKGNSIKTYLTASFVNFSIMYICGMTYYWIIARFYLKSPVGLGFLLIYCFLMFVPGDVTWCVVSSLLAKRLYPAFNK